MVYFSQKVEMNIQEEQTKMTKIEAMEKALELVSQAIKTLASVPLTEDGILDLPPEAMQCSMELMSIADRLEQAIAKSREVNKTMAQIYKFSYVPMAREWTDLQGNTYPPRELGRTTMTVVAESVIEAKRQLEANVADDEQGTIVKDVVLEEVSP